MMDLDTLLDTPNIRAAWVHHGVIRNLYVRTAPVILATRTREMSRIDDALTIANISLDENLRGRGFFTEMVRHVREHFPRKTIYVENTLDPRFARHLVKMGFEEVVNPHDMSPRDPPCWVLWPKDQP